MDRPIVHQRPLMATLPVAARRVAGMALLTLTLWLASFLALLR